MTAKIAGEVREWFEYLFIRNVPGHAGNFIRRLYWSCRFLRSSFFTLHPGCVITSPKRIKVGENVNIYLACTLHAHNNGSIRLGHRTHINKNVILGAADDGEIVIGNDVLIGPNVVMRASNHRYLRKDVPINKQGHTGGKILIEDDVWIGANAVILPDVVIGKGAIVGAGSVVVKSIPPYALAGGVPAKVIMENCR